MSDNLTIDFNMFNEGLRKLVEETVPARAEMGMAAAGMALLNDAVMEIPTVPLLEGFLRGSGSVIVQGKLVATSPQTSGGNPATEVEEPVSDGKIVAIVGFNTPYAAYQHEGQRRDGTHVIKRWTTPGSGIKFLESKLLANGQQYIEIVAWTIRNSKDA